MTTSEIGPEYPPAPWRLVGSATVILRQIDRRVAERFVPRGLSVLSLWPGRTLAGLMLASYGEGSTLRYNELIVFCGIARRGTSIGGWISHIYVDHPTSVEGGREIWGLPKELADFRTERGATLVHQAGRTICELDLPQSVPAIPLPLWMPAFGFRSGEFLRFSATGACRAGIGRVTLDVPDTSPIRKIIGPGAGSAIRLPGVHVSVHLPQRADGFARESEVA